MNRTTSLFSSKYIACAAYATILLGYAANTLEAADLYNSRATFESTLVSFIVDDYEALAYQSGDNFDHATLDGHTNAAMNAIFGETQYTTTGFTDWNLIVEFNGNHYYCAGCNGSYETDLTATSVGTNNGVYGLGLDVVGSEALFGTHAYVTYGDDSAEDFILPQIDAFWGITSNLLIKKIHFGLANGGTNTDDSVQRMAMDNLTIGTNVPEPGGIVLLLGMLALMQLTFTRRMS